MVPSSSRRVVPGLLLVSCLHVFSLIACTEPPPSHQMSDPAEGARQPAAGGFSEVLNEDEACLVLSQAETEARERLGCAEMQRDCPASIRPGGACDGFAYDASSVAACVEVIADYTSCDDFDVRPCIVTAVPTEDSCGGFGGAGGMGGAGGAGGAGPLPLGGAGGAF